MTNRFLGYQFHRPDLDKGFALLFRRRVQQLAAGTETDVFRVRLRGIHPEIRYHVRLESAGRARTVKGAALSEGIDVKIGHAPGAEMILYQRVDR